MRLIFVWEWLRIMAWVESVLSIVVVCGAHLWLWKSASPPEMASIMS